MSQNNILSLLVFCACVFSANTATANERLNFTLPISKSSLYKINAYASEKDSSSLEIAKTDLNGDGLYEFITKKKNCKTAPPCAFDVLAETKNAIISLGTLEGKTLLLGSEYHHGVRSLLVYENEQNDYDYTLYRWSPQDSSYRRHAP